jgi:hypothetical protein
MTRVERSRVHREQATPVDGKRSPAHLEQATPVDGKRSPAHLEQATHASPRTPSSDQ